MKNLAKKYAKPRSLTWWSGAVPLISGLVLALSKAVPQLAPAASVIDAVYGGIGPGVLIGSGLGAIGLRGALGEILGK